MEINHRKITCLIFAIFCLNTTNVFAQNKSDTIANLNAKDAFTYINTAQNKLIKYTDNISAKTIATLEKLSNWENRIHKLLLNVNPTKAQELFGSNTISFSKILEQYKAGQMQLVQVNEKYNAAVDKMQSQLKYLAQQKEQFTTKQLQQVEQSDSIIKNYNVQEKQEAIVMQLIKDRRQQIMQATMGVLKNSKWLSKIDSECYYYSEALQNYKSILSSPEKIETLAIKILEKIPAFNQFFRQYSQIGQLFPMPANGTLNIANLAGLQTRNAVLGQIQNVVGSNASGMESFNLSIQEARNKLSNLQNKAMEQINKGNTNNDFEIPKKYNSQHNKTFKQRLQLKTDWQPNRGTSILPNNINMGFGLAYKLDDKKEIGTMVNYALGLGNSIRAIKLTNEGIGWRSFADFKLKRNIWITAAYEQQYLLRFNSINTLQNNTSAWQQLALAGLSKKYRIGKKGGEIKMLYNFLAKQQAIPTQPLIFRTGINF